MKRVGQPQMIYSDLVTSQGVRLPVSWVFSPMRNDQGATVGMVAVGRDMTGAKHFEAQLHQSQRLAALGVMAGGIAHELRNPLTLCSSGAQFLLEDDVSTEFRKECAEQIKSGDRTGLAGDREPAALRPPPDRRHRGRAGGSRDRIGGQSGAGVRRQSGQAAAGPGGDGYLHGPFFVRGNETLLQHVFINLFLNAIDAMPDGGSLTVSARQCGRPDCPCGGRHRLRHSERGGQRGFSTPSIRARVTKRARGLDFRSATRSSSSIAARSRSPVPKAAAATSW